MNVHTFSFCELSSVLVLHLFVNFKRHKKLLSNEISHCSEIGFFFFLKRKHRFN